MDLISLPAAIGCFWVERMGRLAIHSNQGCLTLCRSSWMQICISDHHLGWWAALHSTCTRLSPNYGGNYTMRFHPTHSRHRWRCLLQYMLQGTLVEEAHQLCVSAAIPLQCRQTPPPLTDASLPPQHTHSTWGWCSGYSGARSSFSIPNGLPAKHQNSQHLLFFSKSDRLVV